MKANRNDLCPCGSGKKYKRCCLQTSTDMTQQNLRSTIGQLQPLIRDFGQQRYGAAATSAAWQSFSRWGHSAIALDEQAYQPAFTAWHLFAWLPDDAQLGLQRFKTKTSDHAIAYDYLETHRKSLSALEQNVIKNSTKSPYSFYTIVTVVSETRLHVREIYTGQMHLVDSLSTTSYTQGDVLFTAVLSVDGMSVFLGCMPHPLDNSVQERIETHRERWSTEEGRAIDRRLLYLHDTELRRFYFMLLGQAQRTQLH